MNIIKHIEAAGCKKVRALLLAYIFIVLLFPLSLSAADTYYNVENKQNISRGVTLESSRRVTSAGLLDVYVLRVSLNDQYIYLSTMKAPMDQGLRNTTSGFVNAYSALAGINGSFFNMDDKFPHSFGAEAANNQIISLPVSANAGKDEFGTFYLDYYNNPFIEYIKSEIVFKNNGVENVKIYSINSKYSYGEPVIINRQAMADTKLLDQKEANLVKLVITDGVITYISQPGENVTIPENGYVIIFNTVYTANKLSLFSVGQSAEYSINSNIDINAVKTAISGGGKLLQNGVTVSDSGLVIAGRNPRSAIGISADNSEIIMMVVEGRSHSVGVTHAELAELMREYGANTAMHFDGGGSSALSVKLPDASKASAVNRPSDGSERKVVNALGVFSNAPVGQISQLVLEVSSPVAFVNSPVALTVYGYDEFYHKIEVPADQVSYTVDNANGSFSSGKYFPAKANTAVITARYGDITTTAAVRGVTLAELSPAVSSYKLFINGSATFSFTGTGVNGERLPVGQSVTYEVVPKALGSMEGNVFTAKSGGMGYVKCTSGGVVTYIKIYATLFTSPISNFSVKPPVAGEVYPAAVKATASYDTAEKGSDNVSLKLSYSFKATTSTQAAYAVFSQKMALPAKPAGLRLNIYASNTGHWLRGRIIDANGAEHTIDFARNINFTGWKQVEAVLPANLAYPITLERIYVASTTESSEGSYTLFIDDLVGVYEQNLGTVTTPAATKFTDPMYSQNPSAGYSINLLPSIDYPLPDMPDAAQANRLLAIAALKKSSPDYISLGKQDLSEYGITRYQDGKYSAYGINDIMFISLNTSAGGIASSAAEQWAKIKGDIENSYTRNVVIYTNTPLSGFKSSVEADMLKALLSELSASGKRIFMVSASGTANSVAFAGGVRYINLGAMFDANGNLNTESSILRLQIVNGEIKYCFEKVFNK